jgi:tetratricopeptide (TPR) repeat protein
MAPPLRGHGAEAGVGGDQEMRGMAGEWTIDFLTVSRQDDPPAEAVVARALSGAGCGQVDYLAASPPPAGAASQARRRLGSYSLREPRGVATGRIAVARHDGPVLGGMGEATFDTLTRGLGADDVRTLREGRLAIDLRVTVLSDAGGAFLAWATRVLLVLLGLTEGAAIDPAAQRCYGRVQLAQLAAATATDPLAHVAIHAEPWGGDAYWLHTHGLQKFARPELELLGVPRPFEAEARGMLSELAENLARGVRLAAGQEIDFDELGRVVALAVPSDLDHQAPFGRLRLVDVPLPGEQLGTGAIRYLQRTVLADAARRGEGGDTAGALEAIERMLSANPDDGAALAFKARLRLRAGAALEALEIAELMQLRAPGDARGPLIAGHALAALGRAREAQRAYTRAIELSPDDGEAFAGRAGASDQLGEQHQAASDRARADYLRAQAATAR